MLKVVSFFAFSLVTVFAFSQTIVDSILRSAIEVDTTSLTVLNYGTSTSFNPMLGPHLSSPILHHDGRIVGVSATKLYRTRSVFSGDSCLLNSNFGQYNMLSPVFSKDLSRDARPLSNWLEGKEIKALYSVGKYARESLLPTNAAPLRSTYYYPAVIK